MEKNIQKQLDIIEASNVWIKNSLEGEKQKSAYRNVINCRRKLNKKKKSLEDNPAAAMYGESQVGKSYLISSLLSEEGKPFSIKGENNIVHNFIEEINPPGGGNESTSLVSRFSVNYKPINSKYPIKASLLLPVDIVLVLCDSFYNDIKADHSLLLQTEQINSEIELFRVNVLGRHSQQHVFSEDHVLDLLDYFREFFSSKASNVLFSRFFDEVSELISKTRPCEWGNIFSLLWNKNEKFTGLFSTLITEYEKLNFADTVYLPMESVLYKNGTLLDVKRLKEIYAIPNKIESEYKAETSIMYVDNGQERNIVFKKSYLCALAAELVFSQQESLLVSKQFLKETDLLDFPGARGRMSLPENGIINENIPELLIRGKVAYLFNKYCEAEKISIFVLCAKHDQAAQRSMPEMLSGWINKFVGDTPEKREKFINTSKIPPLFIIGTFFNVNLEFNPLQDREYNSSSLDYRWNQRFESTLANELLNTKTYQWFNNWTCSDKDFKNIFLLRDFVYSESKSHIFKGYIEFKKEMEEVNPGNYPDFRKKLRQSFIDYPFVKKHFANPVESWDEAASINKDGTKLIIDKLTIAASNINDARRQKTFSELNEISQTIISELKRYFHDGDKDSELQKAKSTAGDIQHIMDTAFRADGIKLFGQMMKEFMLDESSVYKLYREKIDDIERRDVLNLDIYSTYRMHVPVVENDTIDTYFDRLCIHYEKTTDDLKILFKKKLEADGVDLDELINGCSDRIKNFSQQLGEALLDYWFIHVSQNDKRTIHCVLSQKGSTALQDILDMYNKLFKKLQLHKVIAERIRHYVDGNSKSVSAYEMIADISAEILNTCIINVGWEYLTGSDLVDLTRANEKNNLGLTLDYTKNTNVTNVSELFTRVDNMSLLIQKDPEAIKSLPSYHNYIMWYHRLKVGFVSVCSIPNYDVAANEKLGSIIRECETIRY